MKTAVSVHKCFLYSNFEPGVNASSFVVLWLGLHLSKSFLCRAAIMLSSSLLSSVLLEDPENDFLKGLCGIALLGVGWRAAG